MGIQLPPELADVAAQTGVAWPEADEEAMAKQAQAWRDTATSMSTLATDADTTARTALQSVTGEAASKASSEWKTFVEPDSGHLTSVVRDANAAADRLEHAANQVGAAKVEIVRNLVALAQNQDAAHAAAQAGHPLALAGLDTAVRGTTANVAHIETQLVSAVQPASGVDMAAVQNPVNANPGHHLLAGVTTAADPLTHTVTDTTRTVTDTVTGASHTATNTLGHAGLPAASTQGATDLVHHSTGLVADTADQAAPGAGNLVQHGADAVGDTAGHVASGGGSLLQHAAGAADQVLPGGHSGPGGTVDQVASGAGSLVQHTADQVLPGTGDVLPDGSATGPGHPGDLLPGGGIAGPGTLPHPGDLLPGGPDAAVNHPGVPQPGDLPADPEITGPVPSTHFPGDVPTPPVGQTVQAGFAGGLEPAAHANLPPAAAIPQPAAPPGAPAFGGGAPGFAGTPAPPVVGGAPAVGAPTATPAPAQPLPAPRAATPAPVQPAARAAAFTAAPADRPQDPAPRKHMAGPPGAPPPSKGDEVLAAFWIHMFPIGHLPVASYRPARQLPPPPPELDYAAGLRFEPGDHPRFDLVDTAPMETRTTAPSAGLTADHPTVQALLENHDPLGDMHERDWDRRYLVRLGSVTAHGISPEGVEYNWPTSEQYPEGGSDTGEAEVLPADTVIDRFGTPHGRVFAADGTPFAQRSLPPSHKDLGYRRYLIKKPLPVWRAVSAAWFGQPGGGVRYRTTHSAAELVALGYLEEIA